MVVGDRGDPSARVSSDGGRCWQAVVVVGDRGDPSARVSSDGGAERVVAGSDVVSDEKHPSWSRFERWRGWWQGGWWLWSTVSELAEIVTD